MKFNFKKLSLLVVIVFSVAVFGLTVNAYDFPESWGEAPTASEMGITEFDQAPMLEERVSQGELPPVEDRLPDDPLVIKPLEEVGEYGDELVVSAGGPNAYNPTHYARHPYMFTMDPGITKPIPEVAAGYELTDNSQVLTIHLREGLKWSDGHPFTTQDIMFWYDHVVLNDELAVEGTWWRVDGELAEFEAIDDYTLQITFSKPYKPVEGLINYWATQQSIFYEPAHYMKQYHKDFNDNIEELVEEEGFENWTQLYNYHNDTSPGQQDMDVPVVGAWVMKERNSSRIIFERNPYYWAVDTEGNQLPYLDRLEARIIGEEEVTTMELIQGNIDYSSGDINQYPMYVRNQDKGNYTVLDWESAESAEVVYAFNLNHKDSDMRELFQELKFRQAMSLAIDRQELNEFVFLNTATPQQVTVHPGASYYKEEWAEAYADYDPEKAKALLDEIDVVDQDDDGFRELPNGDDLTIHLQNPGTGNLRDNTNQLVIQYWKEIGIDMEYETISRELSEQRLSANDHDMAVWHADRMQELRAYLPEMTKYYMDIQSLSYASQWYNWHLWQQWKDHGEVGQEPSKGTEPPQYVKDYFELRDSWYTATSDEEYQKLSQEFWDFHAENLWLIGTVARSRSPVLVSNNLKNVPTKMPYSDGTSWDRVGRIMQWYKE